MSGSSLIPHPSSLVAPPYDALLIVSFGGPESPDDVQPFLENVTRGRNIPRERLLEVAEHYQHFGGVSPLNGEIRAMLMNSSRSSICTVRTCRFIGVIATGTPCSATRSSRWPTTASSTRWHCYFGLRFLFELPAISRRHCPCSGGSRGSRSANRRDPPLLQSSGIYRGRGGADGRGFGGIARQLPARCAFGLHRA